MESSPIRPARRPPLESPLPSGSGQRPSLLPAFEPLSSSPFPRPRSSKRKLAEDDSPTRSRQSVDGLKLFYPTPVPTSSTGILPSSPEMNPMLGHPALHRNMSMLSDRAPLSDVSTVEVDINGTPALMGRSSVSSTYQLSSASRLISRVHVQASYQAPTDDHPHGEIVIECLGWNGAMVHCRGQVYTLAKGETFSSDRPAAEIMLDVQEARVVVAWPYSVRKDLVDSDSTWREDQDNEHHARDGSITPLARFASSPPPSLPQSPDSPTPMNRGAIYTATGTFILPDNEEDYAEGHEEVKIFEDADASVDAGHPEPWQASLLGPVSPSIGAGSSQSSVLSSVDSDEEFNPDEENDPVVHSFGPFGSNLIPRMASIAAGSPKPPPRQRPTLKPTSPSVRKSASPEVYRRFNESPVKNRVINELAFSRNHSMPLSALLVALPAEMKTEAGRHLSEKLSKAEAEEAATMTSSDLRRILDDTPSVGVINRQGKDAAGKPLENEFYYLPEMDTDLVRREHIQNRRGGSIRSVRTTHKQYFWKRPRF